jgi:GH35 family endo-1,4-beta-xylanase
MLSFPNVTAVITWELVDKYSWCYQWTPRPLPFDSSYQPKSFAHEIQRAIIARKDHPNDAA